MMTGKNGSAKLIAFDFDGTLAHQEKVSERTKAALRLAHEKGCILALSTGRSLSLTPLEVYALPFPFFINSNGARLTDMKSGETLVFKPVDSAVVVEILAGIDESRGSMYAYQAGKALFDRHGYRVANERVQKTPLERVARFIRFTSQAQIVWSIRRTVARARLPIEKFGCIFYQAADCQAVLPQIEARGDVEVLTTMGNDIEITARGATKGNTLAALRDRLGISKEETFAFGDSGNDLSMLEAAGCFFAPQNATPDVLAAAQRIIPSAEQDGVAVALEEMFA